MNSTKIGEVKTCLTTTAKAWLYKFIIVLVFGFGAVVLLALAAPKASAEDYDFEGAINFLKSYSTTKNYCNGKYIATVYSVSGDNVTYSVCWLDGLSDTDTLTFTSGRTLYLSNPVKSNITWCRMSCTSTAGTFGSVGRYGPENRKGSANFTWDNLMSYDILPALTQSSISSSYTYPYPILTQFDIIAQNVTIANIPVSYSDIFYIHASGWKIDYSVLAGEESQKFGWWTKSRRYYLEILYTKNNVPAVYRVPTYLAEFMDIKLEPNILNAPTVNPSYFPDPYINASEYMQSVYYYQANSSQGLYPWSITTPDIDFDVGTWTNPTSSLQSIYLSQLLAALRVDDSSLSDDFLYQDMQARWVGYDDSKVYFTANLNYSVLAEQGMEDAPPEPPDNTVNPTEEPSDVEQFLTTNNYYLSQLITGTPYTYRTYDTGDFTGDLRHLASPEFEYTLPEFSEDGVSLFAWLVNLIYQSPFGILMLVSLTFIVLGAIIRGG